MCAQVCRWWRTACQTPRLSSFCWREGVFMYFRVTNSNILGGWSPSRGAHHGPTDLPGRGRMHRPTVVPCNALQWNIIYKFGLCAYLSVALSTLSSFRSWAISADHTWVLSLWQGYWTLVTSNKWQVTSNKWQVWSPQEDIGPGSNKWQVTSDKWQGQGGEKQV